MYHAAVVDVYLNFEVATEYRRSNANFLGPLASKPYFPLACTVTEFLFVPLGDADRTT